MKIRNETLDAIKGFAILLVVVGHICTEWSSLVQWIFSFHMPFFFMISGYVDELSNSNRIDDITIKEYVRQKLCTLVWPYYIWAIISTGATAVVALKSGNASLLAKTFMSRMLGYEIPDNTIGYIWFLLSLFEAEVCCFILKKLKHEELVWLIWGMGLLLYFIFPQLNLIFLFQLFWIALTCVQIGHLLYRYKVITKTVERLSRWSIKNAGRKFFQMLVLLFLIIILLNGTYANQQVNMVFQQLGTPYLFWSVSIGWSVLFFTLFEWIGKRYHFIVLNKIGRETLVIMAIHFYVNSVLNKLCGELSIMHNMIAMLLYSMVLTVICYVIAKFVRAYMPFLIRLNVKQKHANRDNCKQ